jgi:8-oxo-dGTP pyrophosphatase MutT (NUDIX family)
VTGVTLPGASPVDRSELTRRLTALDRRAAPLEGRKHAAVGLVVVDDLSGGGVLLTKRTSRLRAHPGQWALPGGRLDAGETTVEAALRELHEELGVAAAPDAVLGVLDDYPTRSGYVITPVVLWPELRLDAVRANPDEVASVHVATWTMLAVEPIFLTIEESDRPVIQLPMLGTRIHAPTAAVLYQFRELALHGRHTPVDGLEQPVWAWR